MKARIAQSGKTIRDEIINDAKVLIDEDMNEDPSFCSSLFFWIPGENPKKGERVFLNLYDKKFTSVNGNTQKFQCKIKEKVEFGDYIFDEEDCTYWICTEVFNVCGIHYKGKLTQCNCKLIWQRDDGTILEYPCNDLNSTQYNSGEYSNNSIRFGSSQHTALVQATKDTINLAPPQRFYIGRTNSITYVVTQNDTSSYNYGKGICKITLSQDLNVLDKDRPDLGICDYIQPKKDAESFPEDSPVIIKGKKELSLDYIRTYRAIFDNVNVDDFNFKWNIVSDFKVENSTNGSQIKLWVTDKNSIGKYFLLQIVLDNIVLSEIKIHIVAGL